MWKAFPQILNTRVYLYLHTSCFKLLTNRRKRTAPNAIFAWCNWRAKLSVPNLLQVLLCVDLLVFLQFSQWIFKRPTVYRCLACDNFFDGQSLSYFILLLASKEGRIEELVQQHHADRVKLHEMSEKVSTSETEMVSFDLSFCCLACCQLLWHKSMLHLLSNRLIILNNCCKLAQHFIQFTLFRTPFLLPIVSQASLRSSLSHEQAARQRLEARLRSLMSTPDYAAESIGKC